MAEKVITRVLAALEAGLDRSPDIAVNLDEPLSNVSGALLALYCCGAVEREKLPPRGEGRPLSRYRLIAR